LQPRVYREVRREFTEADLLCFRGRGLASGLVRAISRSPYSHAGLVFLFEEHVYCLEAVAAGVRLCRMSELVRHYKGGIDYFEVLDASLAARRRALGFAFEQLGRRYDVRGVLRFVRLVATGRHGRARADSQWFCSELVAEAYRRAGVPLVEKAAGYVAPHDLAASRSVRLRYRVKR
jgi:uncharacterized protein YycO